jgi:hypothetical protein
MAISTLLFLVCLGFCFAGKQPSTSDNERQPVILPFNPELATCNVTYLTVPSVSGPIAPQWFGRDLILSSVNVPANTPLSNIGFYVGNADPNGNSNVDLLIYNSVQGGAYPGTLTNKFTSIDLATYPINQFGCLPINPPLQFGVATTLWIGFWSYMSYPQNSIARQPNFSGNNYYYFVGVNSPPLGQNFPSNAYNAEQYQLVMGLAAGTASCSGSNCGNCTQNTNCVWCLNTDTCISTGMIPSCPSWTRNPNLCHACSLFNTCQTCASIQYNCSWCETMGKPSVCLRRALDGNCTTAITNPGFC